MGVDRPADHSNLAPQVAYHMLGLRYAFAMTSIGRAVRTKAGLLP